MNNLHNYIVSLHVLAQNAAPRDDSHPVEMIAVQNKLRGLRETGWGGDDYVVGFSLYCWTVNRGANMPMHAFERTEEPGRLADGFAAAHILDWLTDFIDMPQFSPILCDLLETASA